MSDAEVIANLKGSWSILLLDQHFQECASKRHGKIVDGLAVYPNENNNRLRFLELKPAIDDYPDAAGKFHKSIPLVEERLPDGFRNLRVNVELHVKRMPTQTLKFRKALKVGGTMFSVTAFRDGERV
jgi:hypothetical protein